MQENIIQSVLNGNDTLAVLPTGGGKSICFQVPALMQGKLCLVISPLIALMKDQVENLRKKGITAFALYAGMSRREVINTLKVATESNCRFLYVSPERLETSLFQEYLPGMDISLIAVDEAHCISQWGYDFRPPYLRIAALREQLPGVPIMALTASATPEVQLDICQKLSFSKEQIFKHSFERKNLSYSVFQPDSKINRLLEIINKVKGSTIVYCKSRKRTQEICRLLEMQGITADFYHAGLSLEERNKKQEDWITNKVRVIACTNAFGMGIDKPDVRLVIHADVPDCLENYYQEAGRAGRDGKKSYAVLLCSHHDLHDLENQSDARFPSLQDIRMVYQSLANYLQIPVLTGQGMYFDFDFPDFIKKFKINSFTALYAIKALEQDGWLTFNEQVFVQSTIIFTSSREQVNDFEILHPEIDPLIKTLLRTYEGIFDFPASISEKMLAGLIKKDLAVVKNELETLHKYGIIQYQPQKDKPQIFLLQPRIKVEDLTINMLEYKKRKEKYINRLNVIIQYVNDKTQCRSVIIGKYFGDDRIKDCGICNNCLDKKQTAINRPEFESIHQKIKLLLNKGPLHHKLFLGQLNDIKKEKAWEVINFLQAENKIEILPDGKIQWVK